jgi:hypothetical protein
MIDWLLVLTALALVPLVALFAFVGCQVLFPVDDPAEAELISFTLAEGFNTDVETIQVTLTWIEGTIFQGQVEAPTSTNGGEPSVSFTLGPTSVTISTSDLPVTTDSTGVVHCICTISVAGSTVNRDVGHDKLPGIPVLPFVLASVGSDFTLS